MAHRRPEKSIEPLVFWSKKYGDFNKFILFNNNLCIFQVRLVSCQFLSDKCINGSGCGELLSIKYIFEAGSFDMLFKASKDCNLT